MIDDEIAALRGACARLGEASADLWNRIDALLLRLRDGERCAELERQIVVYRDEAAASASRLASLEEELDAVRRAAEMERQTMSAFRPEQRRETTLPPTEGFAALGDEENARDDPLAALVRWTAWFLDLKPPSKAALGYGRTR